MSYFLVISIVIAVLAILYVWYVTREFNFIPSDKPVALDTAEDKLLVHWYRINIKPSFDFTLTDSDIAAKYLNRLYELEVNPTFLVLGTHLESQYFKVTGNRLGNSYAKDTDSIFDIRSDIGKEGEIAIIHNPKTRELLRQRNTLDMTEILSIMTGELDIVARDYLRDLLKARWEHIIALNDPEVLNNSGSYLYLRALESAPLGTIITLFTSPNESGGGVTALITEQGARINLLCSNFEFEEFIKRWKNVLTLNT